MLFPGLRSFRCAWDSLGGIGSSDMKFERPAADQKFAGRRQLRMNPVVPQRPLDDARLIAAAGRKDEPRRSTGWTIERSGRAPLDFILLSDCRIRVCFVRRYGSPNREPEFAADQLNRDAPGPNHRSRRPSTTNAICSQTIWWMFFAAVLVCFSPAVSLACALVCMTAFMS